MITLFSLLIICLLSYYLTVCDQVDDGVVGRIGLAIMSLSSGVGFFQQLSDKADFEPVGQAIFVSLAILLMRQVYKLFKRRYSPCEKQAKKERTSSDKVRDYG